MAEFGRNELRTDSNFNSAAAEVQPLIFSANDLPSSRNPGSKSSGHDGGFEIALLSLERAGQMNKQGASDSDRLATDTIVLARADGQSKSRGNNRQHSRDEDQRSQRRDNADRLEKKPEKNEAVEKLLGQIVKTAREHWGDKLWDPENRDITNNGELGCAISVSKVLMESGAVEKGFKPQLSVTKLDNALRNVNWHVVGDNEPIKPGYVIIGYNSESNWRAGNGNSHVGIVGAVGLFRNDLLIWNNSSRTLGEPYWKQEGKLLALRPWKYDKTFVLKPPGA